MTTQTAIIPPEFNPSAIENVQFTKYCGLLNLPNVTPANFSPNGININEFAILIARKFRMGWIIAITIWIIIEVVVCAVFDSTDLLLIVVSNNNSSLFYFIVVSVVLYIWIVFYHINLFKRWIEILFRVNNYGCLIKAPSLVIFVLLIVLPYYLQSIVQSGDQYGQSAINLYITSYIGTLINISFYASFLLSHKKVGFDSASNRVEIRKTLAIIIGSSGGGQTTATAIASNTHFVINLSCVNSLNELLLVYYAFTRGRTKPVKIPTLPYYTSQILTNVTVVPPAVGPVNGEIEVRV